jgi:adenine-specific DNA-methyltransferase
LGETLDSNDERYNFSWAGRNDTFKVIQTPSRGTLIPDRKSSVNFDTTENIFIEGDNLEVLKLLQKSYYETIKLMYIDPPYNIGKDFIYKDDFRNSIQTYLERTGQVGEDSVLLTSNLETSGRFHSDWISMMYCRLFVAYQLLADDGIIIVSIDYHEHAHLRLIMNEIFGEENLIAELIWNLGTGTEAGHFTRSHENIIVFAKHKEKVPYFAAVDKSPIEHGALKKISKANPASDITFPAGLRFEGKDAVFKGELGGAEKQIIISEKMVFQNGKLKEPVTIRAGWAMKNQILSWLSGDETFDTKGQKVTEFYFNKQGILWYKKERDTRHPKTVLSDIASTKDGSQDLIELFGESLISFPKPVDLIKFLIGLNTKGNDIVMDFFAGACPTAQAVLELNREDGNKRRFIMVQLAEATPKDSPARRAGFKTISDLGKERIRRVLKNMKNALNTDQEDLGFKVFNLAKSNFKWWDSSETKDVKKLKDQITLFETGLFDGYDDLNVIYECIIKEGFSLNSKIEKLDVKSNSIYKVTDANGSFQISMDKEIKQKTIDELELNKDELFFCIDTALNDSQKTNLSKQCILKTI